MLLEKTNVKHVSTLTHEGKVLLMGTVVENGSAKLYYLSLIHISEPTRPY